MVQLDTGKSGRGWSFYGAFRKCPRLFFYAERAVAGGHNRGGARGLGSVFHALAANHFNGVMGRMHYKENELAVDAAEANNVGPADLEMILDRFRFFRSMTALQEPTYRPVMVEERVVLGLGFDALGQLKDPVLIDPDAELPPMGRIRPGVMAYFTTRVDLAVEQVSSGLVWIVDHKTAANIQEATFTRYSLSGQIHSFYHVGKALFGDRFAGVMINAVQTRRGRRVICAEPRKRPQMINEFPKLLIYTADEVARADQMFGMKARNWPAACNETVCVSNYGVCDYAERCGSGG